MLEPISPNEVLYLALGVVERFRCKKIAQKPDARSWAIEQDFLAGAEAALKLSGRCLHSKVIVYQKIKKSITTLTIKDFSLY